ncbi:exodeoxyribonuclease VII large subunit [Candidatus Microgenomates bacterium]|nr:exodeoxyribonuclease VII large subunit [Candidatus Microgenomates bacterium]
MQEPNLAQAPMSEQVLSVSEFVELVNQTLEFAYPAVVVEGEVSDFRVWRNQYVYFDLKDEEAAVNCFMVVYQLKTPLEDGMRLRVTASPKVTQKGRFSLTVASYELAGAGDLKRAFELLKAKLEKEGLFAAARKRPLPSFPSSIAVVSSREAAGYRDFVAIVTQRWAGLNIALGNVQVQGMAAPDQIVAAIEYFNQATPLADVLVVIRGGGSLEDLQAFNSEPVVRAIAASRIPTIVGVGHEQDVTLADSAADMRAATPTDAARRIVPDKKEVLSTIAHQQAQLKRFIKSELDSSHAQVTHGATRLEQYIELPKARVAELVTHLTHQWRSLQEKLVISKQLLSQQQALLIRHQRTAVEHAKQSLESLLRTLMNLDPKVVLRRGYVIARLGKKIVRSGQDVTVGDLLRLQLAQDNLLTQVKRILSRE